MLNQFDKDKIKDNVKELIELQVSPPKHTELWQILYNGEQVAIKGKRTWSKPAHAKCALRRSIDWKVDRFFESLGQGKYKFTPTNKVLDWEEKQYFEQAMWEYIYTEMVSIERIK